MWLVLLLLLLLLLLNVLLTIITTVVFVTIVFLFSYVAGVFFIVMMADNGIDIDCYLLLIF